MIASHSPILLAYPGATIYERGASGIEQIGYDVEVVRLIRSSLNSPDRFLHELLGV